MARRLRCPRCGSNKYWIIRGDKRRCAKCRYEWRPSRLPLRLSPLQWRRLLGWFVKGVRTGVIAQEAGLHRQRVFRALTLVRKIIAAKVSPGPEDSSRSPGLAILCDKGKIWIEVVSGAKGERLLPHIPKPLNVQAAERSPNEPGLAESGIDHFAELRVEAIRAGEMLTEKKQLNRLRGFSGYLRRQLGGRGGIRRERWPLYLAEYVWRYNVRKLPQEQQVRELVKLLREKGSVSG